MNGHHLILGQLTDYISGQILDDTLDERHRQHIGRLLVKQKGFSKVCITSRHALEFQADGKCARLLITYCITLNHRVAMLIQYGPGSLVTRHRPTLALGRLVTDYQVPVVVVTNGETADTLSGESGRRLAAGLDGIPGKDQLQKIIKNYSWTRISTERATMEARILMAYEIDGRCPCDDSVCIPVAEPKDNGNLP